MPIQSSTNPGVMQSLWSGLRRRCPRCGVGEMFSGYLSVRHTCSACNMEFEPLRSDDAPPYVTLFIVGHVVVSLYLAVWQSLDLSPWSQIGLWCGLTLVLSLALLPFIKGGVMAVIFSTKAGG